MPATDDSLRAPADLEVLQVIVDRARAGDVSILPELRRVLDEHPAIWQRAGDLASRVEDAWVALAAGPDLLARESLGRALTNLKVELTGSSPSVMERLLVERVTACWLQMHQADAVAAQGADLSVAQATQLQRRQDRAHRRYLTALKALATWQKLQPDSGDVGQEAPSQMSMPRDVLRLSDAVDPAILSVRVGRPPVASKAMAEPLMPGSADSPPTPRPVAS